MDAPIPSSGPLTQLRDRLRQRLAWASFAGLYLIYLPFALHPLPQAPGAWFLALLNPLAWFACTVWLAPLPWQWRPAPGARGFLRACLLAFLGVEAAFALSGLLLEGLAWILGLATGLPPGVSMFQGLAFLGPFAVAAGGFVARRELGAAEREEARRLQAQAEMRLLQSRLHPRILFRAMEGLAALIPRDPAAAELSIGALSRLLRELLRASECDALPLAEERRLVSHYLAVEALHLGEALQVRWDWEEGLDEVEVLPLLLQPLVEWALHAGAPDPHFGRRLEVAGRLSGGGLGLEVRVSAPDAAGGAEALEGLRKRLDLACEGAYRLELGREGLWSRARLELAYSGSITSAGASGLGLGSASHTTSTDTR